MKKIIKNCIISLTASSVLLLSGIVPAQQRQDRPIDKLKFPPLNFTPPQAEKLTLPNGMRIFLLEDHELPVVNMFALIKTGDRLDPADKVGLADTMATVLRSGGTTNLTPDQINQKLEFVAASIETGMGSQYGSASLSAMSKDITTVLPLFADILMHPAFRDEQIEIARGQALDSINRQNDSPQSIASRIFPQIIYGRNNPLAVTPTEDSIKRITRDDLVQFYSKYYHPNNMILGITGDVKKEDIVKKIEEAFAGWPAGEAELPPEPDVPQLTARQVFFVHKDVNQTSLRIGSPALKEGDPDYFKLRVADVILGGGFSSRIFNELRTKQALAYAAAAGLSGGLGAPGYLVTFSETRADATVKAIQTVLRVIEGMREQPVTDVELQDAKDNVLSSFVFNYDQPEKIVNRQVVLSYFGLPSDYLQKFRDGIAAVTKEDVLEVSKKYYQPDKVAILVIGNEKLFDAPLSSIGPVTNIDLNEWK